MKKKVTRAVGRRRYAEIKGKKAKGWFLDAHLASLRKHGQRTKRPSRKSCP